MGPEVWGSCPLKLGPLILQGLPEVFQVSGDRVLDEEVSLSGPDRDVESILAPP